MESDPATNPKSRHVGSQVKVPPVFPSGNAEQVPEGHGVTAKASPHLAQPDPAYDEAVKQEFLWRTHEYLSESARFGDTKAAFTGTFAAALLGALHSAKIHVPILRVPWNE